MKIVIQLALYAFMFFNLWACQEQSTSKKKITTAASAIKFKKQGILNITDSVGHTKAQFEIELASDDYHRETGLMYRRSMKPQQAMLFVFDDVKPRYFYMKNTFIPLDIIYIGPDKKIIHIVKNAVPLDETALSSIKPAKYTLEIKAGLADEYGLKNGDYVDWNKN